MVIKINHEKCCWKDGQCSSSGCCCSCKGCVSVCPTNALSKKDKLVVDKEKCIDCGKCVVACKHNALSLE